jgi:hypothetical protein
MRVQLPVHEITNAARIRLLLMDCGIFGLTESTIVFSPDLAGAAIHANAKFSQGGLV